MPEVFYTTQSDLFGGNYKSRIWLNLLEEMREELFRKEWNNGLADKLKDFWAAEKEMKKKKDDYLHYLNDMRRNGFLSLEHFEVMRDLIS